MRLEKPGQLIKSVDRTFDILEVLVENNNGLGVTEISKELNLHKSTVYRILATLEYRGYVKKNNQDKYKVGFQLFEIGSYVINNLDLRSDTKPFLEELMKISEETIHLGILDNNKVVYIDKVESHNTIRMYSRIGRRNHAYSTSLGKVLLAYSDEPTIKKFIEEVELQKLTKNTISDEKEFYEHLKKVKKQGYGIDNEEQEYGIRCIAGPIFNHVGEIIASFSISGPKMRMTNKKVNSLKKTIIKYSKKISENLGYNGF